MKEDIQWRSCDVTAAEGMSLRVGSFRASDGEVVTFEPPVLQKIFAKVNAPLPMYCTHKDAGTGKPRVVFGHAVKVGLGAQSDSIHFRALMMDPAFKGLYAGGYDDTSAEVDLIRDETGTIVDGTLTGFAVVPNPAISGTEMKVSAVAFEAPSVGITPTLSAPDKPKIVSSGGIKLTGKIDGILLAAGVPADKVEALVGNMESYFSKKFEYTGLQKKFEDQGKELQFACTERDSMKKKFEDLNKEFETHLGDKVATLVNEVKGMNFANPEAVVEGLPNAQKIAMLSKIKENIVTKTPASQPSVGLSSAGSMSPADATTALIAEMGLTDMWNQTHQGPKVT